MSGAASEPGLRCVKETEIRVPNYDNARRETRPLSNNSYLGSNGNSIHEF